MRETFWLSHRPTGKVESLTPKVMVVSSTTHGKIVVEFDPDAPEEFEVEYKRERDVMVGRWGDVLG